MFEQGKRDKWLGENQNFLRKPWRSSQGRKR